jgi:flagellar hook-associated protein FlgK
MSQKDLLEGETPSLYHIIRTNRRRSTKHIHQVVDESGQMHTTTDGIAQAFLSTFTYKYRQLPSDSDATTNILATVNNIAPDTHKTALERIIRLRNRGCNEKRRDTKSPRL